MHLNFLKNKKKNYKKASFNPHRFWLFLMTGFLIVVTIEMIYFSFFFISSSRKLDAVVAPNLGTNESQIKKIESLIEKSEKAVSDRAGTIGE